ncbi:hypothetical protein D499_0Q00370 [Hanseniaspora uvarum DSM 2768]|nr:hypothetical protein FOG50_02011 [Hanseniaspora uvarum]KKA01902.1 hypothetical protein D499_0Q00370 [Hanseniaspora uvarum DSM 2768]GMM39528.1 putative serine hydrolase [Hanseniaspora uvarum]
MADSKGCILMLHGYKQSDTIFYKKTSGLRKHLTKQLGYELLYPCGQMKIEGHLAGDYTGVEDQPDSVDMFSWLLRDNVTCISKISDEKSVKPLLDYIKENIVSKNKKLVGIIGFSQGACFTSVLIQYYSHLEIFKNLKFGIMFSGFHLDDSSILKETDEAIETIQRDEPIRSLHVMGTLDTVVEDHKTYSLHDSYKDKYGEENTELFKHMGGHYVPNNKGFLLKIATWIESADQSVAAENTTSETKKYDENNKEIPDLDEDLLKSIDNLGF